jgi:hypothetical protein
VTSTKFAGGGGGEQKQIVVRAQSKACLVHVPTHYEGAPRFFEHYHGDGVLWLDGPVLIAKKARGHFLANA